MRDSYVGAEAQLKRGVLCLSYPIERGIITRWDDMESIWNHTFSELNFNPQDERAVLSQKAHNPKPNKEKTAEVSGRLSADIYRINITGMQMRGNGGWWGARP